MFRQDKKVIAAADSRKNRKMLAAIGTALS